MLSEAQPGPAMATATNNPMNNGQSQAEERENRRRKVRKGTHSCWECRRRKIRCQFSVDDDAVCIGCHARGSICRSQEYVDEAPAPAPERKVTQRLDRLESMMERLMEHVLSSPSGGGSSRAASQRSHVQSPSDDGASTSSEQRGPARETSDEYNIDLLDFANPAEASARACPTAIREHGYEAGDVFDTSTAKDTPVAVLLGIQSTLEHAASPGVSPSSADTSMNGAASGASFDGSGSGSNGSNSATTNSNSVPTQAFSAAQKYRHVSRALHALFPAQEDIDIIVGSASALFLVSLFHSEHDIAQGRSELLDSLRVVPPATSHPTVLARRLLQMTLCMQQVSPCFMQRHKLKLQESMTDTIGRISSIVAHTVTANDDLIGNLEGIQCLVLMGLQQSNNGHLRKAWLSFRRALGLAQLMGLDRGNTRALKSCDPANEDLCRRPTPAVLWYRINACDRHVSLLLGLRAGTQGCDCGAADCETDSPVERLEKAHTLLAGRIIERNHSRAAAALPYAITQAIDGDLQAAARCDLDAAWWEVPSYDPYVPQAVIVCEISRTILQVHHYCMLILLHLPYMLRPGDGDADTAYSRTTCMEASREVLRRFINFRLIVHKAFSCRHVDYAALIAAMTLVIGYLGPRPATADNPCLQAALDEQLRQDHAMVKQVRDRMRHMGATNNDKLSRESASTIDQLLPLLDLVARRPETPMPAPVTPPCPTPAAPATCNTQFSAVPCPDSTSPAFLPPMTPSGVRLNVPYFGTVNIHPNTTGQTPQLGSSFMLPQPESVPWQGQLSSPSQDVPDLNTMLVDFDTMDEGNGADFSDVGAASAFPDLTGATDDWAMQGVDTTYWSLLNGGLGAFGGT